MQLVSTKDHVLQNLRVFHQYGSERHRERLHFYTERLRLGKQFVVGKIGEEYAFAPSRIVGYKDSTYERHIAFPGKDGRLTTPALAAILGAPIEDAGAEHLYTQLCISLGITPANKPRAYWVLRDSLPEIALVRSGERGFPDEVREYVEGATRRVVVNAYERDRKARDVCVAMHGYDCVVCGFNFFAEFGELGRSFIHVHHLQPISISKLAHSIDPIEDLRPVCPNCHAMLHQSDPPFTIEELIAIRKQATGRSDA